MSYNLYQLTVVYMIAVLGFTSVLTRSYALAITQLIMVIALVISHGHRMLVGNQRGAGEND